MSKFFKALKITGYVLAITGLALAVVPAFAIDLGIAVLSNGVNSGSEGALGFKAIEKIGELGKKLKETWEESSQVSSDNSSAEENNSNAAAPHPGTANSAEATAKNALGNKAGFRNIFSVTVNGDTTSKASETPLLSQFRYF